MNRRAFLSTGLVPLLSGCAWFGIGEEPGGDLHVRNRDFTRHTVEIEITPTSSGATVFENSIYVEEGQTVEVEEAFGGGSFDVDVALDDGRREEFGLNVGSCPNIRLRVVIGEDELRVEQSYCT